MKNLPEYFGSMVFNDRVMKERLRPEIYRALHETMKNGTVLYSDIADEVAEAMKNWAIEKGATHFTHWFQPMTGVTAEKHDSFLVPSGGGSIIMEFKGKELIKGESDASSFPSGGLRNTFEARGYTAWDPTSYAFIKDNVLCIPTAFCSYGGHALDKKTPLLRSMEALNKAVMQTLHLFGETEAVSVSAYVGSEQEYFLVDKDLYDKREDLVFTGRTLFGAMPPKGQELDDHYYGAIKQRVSAYFHELDEALWNLGIPVKTEHNEAAPSQHELAPMYMRANVSTDQNQLTMEIMQSVAKKNGLVCLLHEKPFSGVNGSGKHNNWSVMTDTGVNLFTPGDTPHKNARFLLFLCAVIKAVDEHQDLLRIAVASAGNDRRLGANEAPPAVISMFLGDELTSILDSIENDSDYTVREKDQIKLGAHVLPRFLRDTTDRNRTSPFAFTGNKFEFLMLGSADSIACANIMINTAFADALTQINEALASSDDFDTALHTVIKKTYSRHKRIVFNGNGYDEKWIKEATEVRGLLNYRTTPEALVHYTDKKNIELFERQRIFTESEVKSRYEIILANYCKVVNIEARTACDMVNRDILPAISRYTNELQNTIIAKRRFNDGAKVSYEENTCNSLCDLEEKIYVLNKELENNIHAVDSASDVASRAFAFKDSVLPVMDELRTYVDKAETMTASDMWPYPTYSELLFSKI